MHGCPIHRSFIAMGGMYKPCSASLCFCLSFCLSFRSAAEESAFSSQPGAPFRDSLIVAKVGVHAHTLIPLLKIL